MHFTYIIESPTGRWYYGHCVDIERRLHQHNIGQNKSTRNRGPWKLIFVRPFGSKLELIALNCCLKKVRNKKYILSKYPDYICRPVVIEQIINPLLSARKPFGIVWGNVAIPCFACSTLDGKAGAMIYVYAV